jgi:hypothetical protein
MDEKEQPVRGTPLERRFLHQTFFEQIFICEDAEVVGTTLTAHAPLSQRAGTRASARLSAHLLDAANRRPRCGRRLRWGPKRETPAPFFEDRGSALLSNGGDGGNRTHVRGRT